MEERCQRRRKNRNMELGKGKRIKGERDERRGEVDGDRLEREREKGEEKREEGRRESYHSIRPVYFPTNLHTTQPTLQMHVSRQFSAPFNRLLLYALVVHGLYTYIVAHRVPRKPEIPRAVSRIRLLKITPNHISLLTNILASFFFLFD